MTSKELAEDLFNKMYDAFANDEEDHWEETVVRIAKRCSNIAVDIVAINSNETQEYFVEVKNEIENMWQSVNN